MLEIVEILFFVVVTSAALILLKLGTVNGAPIQYKDKKIQLNINSRSMAGILLYGLSFLIYTYLISKNDLGYIIPLTTALVYIVIFTASNLLFHERFTTMKISGIVLILSGIVLLNLNH